jgi:hypothetical protein
MISCQPSPAEAPEIWPWEAEPYRLWSLLDMLSRYAYYYNNLGVNFGDALHVLNGATPFIGPDDEILTRVRSTLKLAKVLCDASPFAHIASEIEVVQRSLDAEQISTESLTRSIATLMRLFGHALKAQWFYRIDSSYVSRFEAGDEPFGHAVSTRFPVAAFDISEAGRCLALERSTASVFHLMRVMEHAVQRLGRNLKIPLDPKKGPLQDQTWHGIMVGVSRAIDSMPRGKKKVATAGVAVHLGNVRIAWRNETMHPKATYTQEEAVGIWNNVNAFMQSLARVF